MKSQWINGRQLRRGGKEAIFRQDPAPFSYLWNKVPKVWKGLESFHSEYCLAIHILGIAATTDHNLFYWLHMQDLAFLLLG
jgi:hypothetical protein